MDNWECLWEMCPAERFEDAHLLGNGRLGAAVFGGLPDERIVINDDTFWSGSEGRYVNSGALTNLAHARELVFSREYSEASELIESRMLGAFGQSYQTLGNFWISMVPAEGLVNDHRWRMNDFSASSYKRALDISRAVETINFSWQNNTYSREYFVSHPANALLIRWRCEKDPMSFELAYENEVRGEISTSGDEIVVTGRAPDHVAPNYVRRKPAVLYLPDDESDSLRFAVVARILKTDGKVVCDPLRITVIGANESVIAISAHTNYTGYRKKRERDTSMVVTACKKDLEIVAQASFDELQDDHTADYRRLYGRVSVEIEPSPLHGLATSKRLELHGDSKIEDPSLPGLALQYARYLLISSSRPGTQAANLQGIWNHLVRPPWSSNYTTNINVEMNYWPAEVLNLTECHEPLFDLIAETADSGADTAEKYYGLEGWTAHHNVDLWRSSIPANGLANWAYWPMAAGWMCQHLWTHFLYTGDREFLDTVAYPLIEGAAKFLLGWLVEDEEGYLSTAPSTSPENNFYLEDIADMDPDRLQRTSAGNRMVDKQMRTTSVSKSSTMDLTIIREVFTNCIQSARTLDRMTDFHGRLNEALGRLYPLKIGKHGQLQEWCEDFSECTPGMGHVSHMYGLYPGYAFTETENREVHEACRVSMMRRLSHGGHTGHWPAAWAISLFARLHEPFLCGRIASTVFKGLGANMMTENTYQLDCIFGIGAGIGEMLLQSHNGYIELLPAVPPSWRKGNVSGIRAIGGFEVSAKWNRGSLTSGTISSSWGNTCRLKIHVPVSITCDGVEVSPMRDDRGVLEFPTEAGLVYEIAT